MFYYLNAYALGLGVANAGWFFTLSTLTEIAARLVSGPLLDRWPKPRLLTWSLALLVASYVMLAAHPGQALFQGLGLAFGLAWGLAMPIMNAHLFDLSPPQLRPLATNLGMMMFQAGFVVGPLAGGMVLKTTGYEVLYLACAGACLAALAMTSLVKAKAPDRPRG